MKRGTRKPSNQQLRTRKDLLTAASRLMKQGRKPTMDEVAQEALVSRPTAYRYFKSVDALLGEAPVDAAVGKMEDIFVGNTSDDAETRIDEAEAAMHKVTYQNEAHLRVMLANAINRDPGDNSVPRRQNRRIPLIEAALATSRGRFGKKEYETLCSALALVFGTESMIVFRDVLRTDEATARKVKSWAARALVRAALEESAAGSRKKK
ncbi:MAG TPA: TetR/AcrR family transcriptional regulator [Opitutaceae bacterium]